MSPPAPELIEKMHRYFAVECNNRAWELAEQATRSPEEDEELTTTAHAAAYHWAKVGNPLNIARARQLLGEVHAQAGDGARALALAEECRHAFAAEGGTEWDRAFASLELAFAHAVCGNREEAQSLLEAAAGEGTRITESEERDFFQESHHRIAHRISSL